MSRCDVLHADPGNPSATLVGDLATGAGIPRISQVIQYDRER